MLKAILFDLDNTLLDFSGFKRETARAAAEMMRKQGWSMSVDGTVKRIFKIYKKEGIEYQKTFADLVYGAGYRENEAERIQQAAIIGYNKRKFAVLKPYPGIKHVLGRLRGHYRLAVLSDAPRNKAWQRLILSGLDGFFEEVGTFHDTELHKPNKAPFLRMCRQLRVKPSECLFVGDNPARDIAGAKSVGMKTAWAKYGHVIGNRDMKANFVLKNPVDLLKVLSELRK